MNHARPTRAEHLTHCLIPMEGGTCCSYPALPQRPPVLDESWTGSSLSGLPLYPHHQAFLRHVYPTSGPIQGIDGGSGTTYSERLLPPSTSLGHEGVPAASMRDPAYTELADVETCFNSRTDDKTLNFTLSPTLTEISRNPCDTWDCSQPQGDSRHRGVAHGNLFSCFFSGCEFKWTSPCQYMTHFEERHSNVKLDDILGKGKPARSRRRSTIIGRDPPQHHPDETWQPPLMPPSSAVATVLSRTCEDSRVSEYSDAPDTPVFLSTEERAQSVNGVGGQLGFHVSRFPPAATLSRSVGRYYHHVQRDSKCLKSHRVLHCHGMSPTGLKSTRTEGMRPKSLPKKTIQWGFRRRISRAKKVEQYTK
ncbi:hypothetical protein BJV77DRAFT_1001598 [Russula vinacea]|nr:hypothetical protein BJV77DRAFT_1001598 [Russula vinacea]